MCHISYRETKVRSNQRKPGTAKEQGNEGKTEKTANEKMEAVMLIFFRGQWDGYPLVADTMTKDIAQWEVLVTA